jgi:cyclopropane-fatty-acyl-phospholipid synthase
MQAAFNWIGRQFKEGSLEFRTPDGRSWTLGNGAPHALIDARDRATLRRMLLKPQLAFGETYMEGAWVPADGDLIHTLEVAMRMVSSVSTPAWLNKPRIALSKLRELNTPLHARRRVSHHYDLDYALYSAFLDRDLHYSCAYFSEPGMTLEAAQQAKCAHIAAKLDLKRGARVLDIGCGWGSLALYLAEHFGVHVTGVTLSVEQLAVAKQRVVERGLQSQVDLRLEDYRDVSGEFDAVVSVGMFEHVGRPQYATYFRHIRRLLTTTGTALLHTIGRTTPPGVLNPWIGKYIFPGGYIPAASEVLTASEPSGLVLNDFEVWRLHYAQTLAEWQRRFQARRSDFEQRFGARFCRMWEFYLAASEASFRWGDLVVFHLQFTRDLHRLPLTRDYLYRDAATVTAQAA